MKPIEVIESKAWVHTSGRKASIYGAVPWTIDADKPNWSIVTTGYTLRMDNGTVGYGRPPLPTREEAEAVLANWR